MRGLGLTLLYAFGVMLIIYSLLSVGKFLDQYTMLMIITLLLASIVVVFYVQKIMSEEVKQKIIYMLSKLKIRRKQE